MPTQKFAGMNVLQPVGLLPRAANASRQPSSSQTAWTPHSQRLMTAPAIRPEPISRGQDGCCAITCSPKLLRTSRPPNQTNSRLIGIWQAIMRGVQHNGEPLCVYRAIRAALELKQQGWIAAEWKAKSDNNYCAKFHRL